MSIRIKKERMGMMVVQNNPENPSLIKRRRKLHPGQWSGH